MPGLMGRATLIIKAKFSRFLDRSQNPNRPPTTPTRSSSVSFRT